MARFLWKFYRRSPFFSSTSLNFQYLYLNGFKDKETLSKHMHHPKTDVGHVYILRNGGINSYSASFGNNLRLTNIYGKCKGLDDIISHTV